jgi:hypothetical protein
MQTKENLFQSLLRNNLCTLASCVSSGWNVATRWRPLFHQHRVTFIFCQNRHAGSGAPDDRGADENRFHVARARALLKIGARLMFATRLSICRP